MVSNSITYQCVHGNSDKALLQQLLKIYTSLFKDADVEFFKRRYNEHSKIMSVLAYDNQDLVGFKIGYPYNEDTFYSWIGGVLPNYRKQGIANELAEQQELFAKFLGFKKMRTKSMNTFKPMMTLNLKRGFDITKVYSNEKGQTKIIFEKGINHQ